MADEKIFPDGFIMKPKHENAPDFVIAKVSVKCEEFAEFMRTHHNNGWINLDLKFSQSGKPYAQLDTWKPDKAKAPAAEERDGSIPF